MSEEKCKVLRQNGEYCGRDLHQNSDKCWLHFEGKGINKKAEFTKVWNSTADGVLDLSNGFLNDVNVEKLTEFNGKSIEFQRTRFEGCSFKDIAFVSPNFKNCYFEDTFFSDVQFVGDSISFASSQALFNLNWREKRKITRITLFHLCYFGPENEKHCLEVNLSFRYVKGADAIFDYCRTECEVFKLIDTEIEMENLKILIDPKEPGQREFIPNPHQDKLYLFGLKDTIILHAPKSVILDGLNFTGKFELYGSEDPQKNKIIVELSLKDIMFGNTERCAVRLLSLRKARFARSEIAVLRFYGVDWPKESGKVILYDEGFCESSDSERDLIECRDNLRPGELKRLYEALLKAYDDARDYPLADEWYFRLQEFSKRFKKDKDGRYCERGIKIKSKLRFHKIASFLSFAGLYKFSSDYGESWFKPIRRLAILNVLLFPFVYLLVGSVGVNYDIAFDLNFLGDGEFRRDWIDTCIMSVKSTGFRGLGGELKPGTTTYQMTVGLNLINFLFNATLISLFIISLKRKFRRR